MTGSSPPRLWWDLTTEAGRLTLAPVRLDRDIAIIHTWMNDPVVAEYWALAGPIERTAQHVADQQSSAHTEAYLARLAGRPIGYWALYQAAHDPLARHYAALCDDTGIHLLIGEADCRGIGLGAVLLQAVADAVQRERGGRVVAEPDERNIASIRSFLRAGFACESTLDLPEKRATLMVRPKLAPVPDPRRGA
jgi:RimJ/RimL family protein N-acetyltransferase